MIDCKQFSNAVVLKLKFKEIWNELKIPGIMGPVKNSVLITEIMTRWNLPPREKIYEAFSVLADERFEIKTNGKASVTSSAGDKQYSLSWSVENGKSISITSNDNASRWQGYIGYPIIALLMILDKITYDKSIIGYFNGIPWKVLNKAHKNKYSEVVEILLKGINDGAAEEKIRTEVDRIFKQLVNLELVKPETFKT